MGTESKNSPISIRVGILNAPKIDWEPQANGFLLKQVRIGIGFHWDRREDQEFAGELRIQKEKDGSETAVNILDLEDYLCSVISSEMSADSPMELLKAHAIISRSWALRAIEANRANAGHLRQTEYESNGHKGYDVCADDHCQRYEGLRRMNPRAVEAVRATAGEVLVYTHPDGKKELCDCRYYKCCGGKTEVFATCWEDKDIPYLKSVSCGYCDTHDQKILQQVLNNYDQETRDFHDWEVCYSRQELHDILLEKSGIDFGTIQHLIPRQRGTSGRICQLEIVGSKQSETIGKELKIRRWLSKSCLYSSWFDIAEEGDIIRLKGHGWGHGVGLCQIGAAVMGTQGKTYTEILDFYYPGTHCSREA